MKKLVLLASFVAFLSPFAVSAQSGIDGTWKFDMKSAQFSGKPDVFLLQNGNWTCKTCAPAVEVKADGQDHKVTGHPYYDTVAINVVDDHTIAETDKKAGKTVSTSTAKVSADGKMLTFDFTDSTDTNAAPVTGKISEARITAGPAGSHAISGSWRPNKVDSMSDNGLMMTFKVEGDMLNMSSPTGQSYSAKLDGTDAPYKGDPGIDTVSVKRVDKNTFEETDKRGSKVIAVVHTTVSADGKTMHTEVHNLQTETTTRVTGMKQ